jgi:hypothetical protein
MYIFKNKTNDDLFNIPIGTITVPNKKIQLNKKYYLFVLEYNNKKLFLFNNRFNKLLL